MRGLTSPFVGVLVGIGIVLAAFCDLACGGYAPRLVLFPLALIMIAWLVARTVRSGWQLPAAIGAVTVLGFSLARSAGGLSRDSRILAESGNYERVAEILARLAKRDEPTRVERPLPGILFAVVSTDVDTGGVAVRFAFDDSSRRTGVIVYVGAKKDPKIKTGGFCLRHIKDALYQYDVCN